MKFKRINLLLITTLVLLGYLASAVHVNEQQDPLQKPIKVHATNDASAAGLAQDITPEQIESLETEKYTFQVI